MSQFLTFVIGSNQPEGVIDVTGQFDEAWGLTVAQGPAMVSRFGTISLGNNRLHIVWKGGGTNHRFNLRFSDANQDGYSFSGGNVAQAVAQTAELRDTPA